MRLTTFQEKLFIIGVYPGLLIFTSETGLNFKYDFLETNIYIAVIFKWIYTVITIISNTGTFKKAYFKYILFYFLFSIFAWLSVTPSLSYHDGLYPLYWFSFTGLAINLFVLQPSNPKGIINILMIFLLLDYILVFSMSGGGGIFHQHRQSGILALILFLKIFDTIFFIKVKSHFSNYLLISLSLIGLYSCIFFNATRQMIPYSFFLVILSFWVCRTPKFYIQKLKSTSKYHFITIIIIVISLLPVTHLMGYTGDLLYNLTNFVDKTRSALQNSGRESLYQSILLAITSSELYFFKPFDFSESFVGGSVSAHNFYIQTYLNFGVIFFILTMAMTYFLIFIGVVVSNYFHRHGKLLLYFVLLSTLLILNFNDEGGVTTRAPAIILYFIPIYLIWMRLRICNHKICI